MSARLPAADLAAVMAVTILWGGNVIAVKYATHFIPPFLTTGLRFLAVAVLLLPFTLPNLRALKQIWPIGLLMGVGHFGLLFLGLSRIDAATGSVATQLGVPFSVILSWLLLNDRLGAQRIVGLVMAFLGVVVLAGAPGQSDPWAVGIVVFSDLMWATAMLLIKKSTPLPPMVFNGWMAAAAAPCLLLLSWGLEQPGWDLLARAPLSAWLGLAYTVVGASLIAYTLWYRLLARHAISRVVPYTLLAPLVAYAASAWMLGEDITFYKILGAVLTLAGVAIIEMPFARRNAPPLPLSDAEIP